MEHPILNPPNPYVGPMRVFPGSLIKISGRARYSALRFAVNLQTGPCLNPRDDLALHLSPCFNPPRVVRNALISSSWGPEEASGPFLFSPGQPFEIMILCQEHCFKIAINGGHFCDFSHRVSYEEVTHLTIDGDVDIERIVVSDSNSVSGHSASPRAPPASAPVPISKPFVGPPPLPNSPLYPQVPGVPSGYPPQPNHPSMTSGGAPYPPPYPGAAPHPSQSGYGVPSYAPASYPGGPSPAPYSGGPSPAPYSGGPSPAPYPGGPSSAPPTHHPYSSNNPYYPQGPTPAQQPPHGYQQGPYPPQPGGSAGSHHQGQKSPLDALPSGLKTLAGLGLGAAAGAAALSLASSPFKTVKKALKPKKFKKKGWGRSSSSSNSSKSSISSRSSFSSNSS